ncbi:MAG: acyl-CoA dehydrogenase family protein [Caulobacter sp.]|nr:acyl-CoA dehydrogenase family protein [Caulobacter sp.]
MTALRALPIDNAGNEGPVDEVAFLAEVRAFLAVELTSDLREAGRNTLGVHADIDACRIWHRRLYEHGWIAPSWPKAWGGTGWTARQRFLFDTECVRNDAPVLFAGGIRSLGPLLIEMGSPAQRARYLPSILSGENLWCQGFSEPGAGSDLAAVSTRAVRRGDRYVVNGSKIWTTGAHHASHMFAIVRTADGEKRQQGMTFLLIDMASPGLTVKPIIGLAGDHEFNAVFFDDVEVPVDNRVGPENDGWTVAKRLMSLARSNNTPAALVGRVLRRTALAVAAAGEALEPSVRTRLAGLQIEHEAFTRFELDALPSGLAQAGPGMTPSMLKLIGSELHQRVAELAMAVAGPLAAADLSVVGRPDLALSDGARATAKHLSVRAASIYSGTSETQRNVIARQLLG